MADSEQCQIEMPELGLLLEGQEEQDVHYIEPHHEVHHEAEYEPYHGAHPEHNAPLLEDVAPVMMEPMGSPVVANGHSHNADMLSISPSNANEMEAIDLDVADYIPVPLDDCTNNWCTKDHVSSEPVHLPAPPVAGPVYRYPRPTGADPDVMNPRTSRQAMKGLCCLVMFCTVVIVALVCFSIYWGTRGHGDKGEIIVVDPRTIDPLYRSNCTHAWSTSTMTKSQCEVAGCWYVPDDPAVTYDIENVPECFYPYPNYGYKVSSAVKVMDDQGMTTLTLALRWKDDPIPGMVDKLEVKVNVKETLVEVVIQKDTLNYSMANTAGASPVGLSTVTVEYGTEWFYLLITSSAGTTLLDTRASPLIYIEESVIQLTSVLDRSYIVYSINQDPYNMSYRSEVMEGSSNESYYSIPAYIARKDNESFGVIFSGGDARNEVYLTPRKTIRYTSWYSSSLSMFVFLGPRPDQVVKNMVSKIRGSVEVPPSWMFELTYGESGATNHEYTDKQEGSTLYREVSGADGAKFSMDWSLFPTNPNATGLCLQGLTSDYTIDGSSSRWDTLPRAVQNTLNANMLGVPFTGVCTHSVCGPQDNVTVSLQRLKIWLPYTEIITECGEQELNKDIQSAMELRQRLNPTWYAMFYQSQQDNTGVIRLTSHSFPDDPTAVSFDTELRQIMLRDMIVVPVAHLFTQGPVTSQYYLPTLESWFVSNGEKYMSVESGQGNYTDYPMLGLTSQDQFYVRAGIAMFTSDVDNEDKVMEAEGADNAMEGEGGEGRESVSEVHLTILLDGNNKAKSVGDIGVSVDGSVTIVMQGGSKDIAITRLTIQDLAETLTTPIPYKTTYESVEGESRVVQGQIAYEDIDDSSSVVTLYHRLELGAADAGVKTVTLVLETAIPQK